MVLRITGNNNRLGHIGTAVAGLASLSAGFPARGVRRPEFFGSPCRAGRPLALALFVLAGIADDLLDAGSAAVIAIALSPVYTGSISLRQPLHWLSAPTWDHNHRPAGVHWCTSNAKRISAAHVIFNPGQAGRSGAADAAGGFLNRLDPAQFDLVSLLPMFTPCSICWGAADVASDRPHGLFLKQRFRTQEEDEATPQYLTKTSSRPSLGG